jgi:protein-disulfide isomerase
MTTKTHGPVLTLPVGVRDHAQGPETALVTLVEYGDYQCPYCGRAYPIVKALQKRMRDSLRFVFRNFPITALHPHAEQAAQAAEAAGEWGKFWEMHDLLFEHQRALGMRHLAEYAERLGLDPDGLVEAIERGTFEARVREDFMTGVRSGVNGTPTFFINGARHDGMWDLESLTAAVETALRAVGGDRGEEGGFGNDPL